LSQRREQVQSDKNFECAPVWAYEEAPNPEALEIKLESFPS
jgi:hypothetical protein